MNSEVTTRRMSDVTESGAHNEEETCLPLSLSLCCATVAGSEIREPTHFDRGEAWSKNLEKKKSRGRKSGTPLTRWKGGKKRRSCYGRLECFMLFAQNLLFFFISHFSGQCNVPPTRHMFPQFPNASGTTNGLVLFFLYFANSSVVR